MTGTAIQMIEPEPSPEMTEKDITWEKAKDQLLYLFSHEGLAWMVIDMCETYDKKLIKLLEMQYDKRNPTL